MPQGPVPSPACSCLGLPHMYLTCRQTPAIAYTPPCPASWLLSATRAEALPGSPGVLHPSTFHPIPSLRPPWPWMVVRVGGPWLYLLGAKRYLLPNTSLVVS